MSQRALAYVAPLVLGIVGVGYAGEPVPTDVPIVPPLPPGFDAHDAAFVVESGDLELHPNEADIGLANVHGSPSVVELANGRLALGADVWLSNEGAGPIDLRGCFMVFDMDTVYSSDPSYRPVIVPSAEDRHDGAFQVIDVWGGGDPDVLFGAPGLEIGFVLEGPDPLNPDPDIFAHQGCIDTVPEAPLRAYDLSPLGILQPKPGAGHDEASRKPFTLLFDLGADVDDPAPVLAAFQFCGDFLRRKGSEPIVVDEPTEIDLSTSPPSFTGDADLAPFVVIDTTAFLPEDWRVDIDLGNHHLQVTDEGSVEVLGAQIEPAAGVFLQGAPHVRFRTTGWMEIDGEIRVDGYRRSTVPDPVVWPGAGRLELLANADITVRREIVTRAGGAFVGDPGGIAWWTSFRERPVGDAGEIVMASRCGSVEVAARGEVASYGEVTRRRWWSGSSWGGSQTLNLSVRYVGSAPGVVSLATCGQGERVVVGASARVLSVGAAPGHDFGGAFVPHPGEVALVAFAGDVVIEGGSARARGPDSTVNIQAGRSIACAAWLEAQPTSLSLEGPSRSSTRRVRTGRRSYRRTHYVYPHDATLGSGAIRLTALTGDLLIGNSQLRTFARENVGGSISPEAAGDVSIESSTLDSRGGRQGTAGRNSLRSFSGAVDIDGSMLLATNDYTPGFPGFQDLISRLGVIIAPDATVDPIPSIRTFSTPPAPTPIFTDCEQDFGIDWEE